MSACPFEREVGLKLQIMTIIRSCVVILANSGSNNELVSMSVGNLELVRLCSISRLTGLHVYIILIYYRNVTLR